VRAREWFAFCCAFLNDERQQKQKEKKKTDLARFAARFRRRSEEIDVLSADTKNCTSFLYICRSMMNMMYPETRYCEWTHRLKLRCFYKKWQMLGAGGR
jgi:hypothetical protein